MELTQAREVAEAFLSDAQRSPGSPESSIAHRVFGWTCWFQGDYVRARAHLEQALGTYDHQRDRHLASRFGYDVGVVAMFNLALVLWPLGDVAPAASLAEKGMSLALKSEYVPTIAYARLHTCIMAATRHQPSQASPHAKALVGLARVHELRQWLAWGTFFLGWTRWWTGDRDGEAEMREGWARLRAMDLRVYEPTFGALFAEVEGEAGRVDAGLAMLDAQLELNEQTGAR
jgi:hypothetical protein